MSHPLFSYGTLRDPGVQQGMFGRLLDQRADALAGWTMGSVLIDDPEVIDLSGAIEHSILRHSGDPADRIGGAVLMLSDTELAIADDYETSAYARIAVRLESGMMAFVYVDAGDPASVAADEALG